MVANRNNKCVLIRRQLNPLNRSAMQPVFKLLTRAIPAVIATAMVLVGSRVADAVDPSKPTGELQSSGAKWKLEYQIDRFQLHFDFQPDQPQRFAEELKRFEAELQEMLPGTVHAGQVHVVVFGNANMYRRYMRHYFPKVPYRRAMFIQDRGPGLLFTHWHAEVMTDVRHEVTHALLNHTATPLPLWIDEGLAEYFEDSIEQRFAGGPHFQQLAAVRASKGWQPIPLIELEQVKRLDEFTDEYYFNAWAWAHFLLHRRPETRQLMINQLQRYSSGEAPPPTSRLLREIMPDFEEQFRQHFGQ